MKILIEIKNGRFHGYTVGNQFVISVYKIREAFPPDLENQLEWLNFCRMITSHLDEIYLTTLEMTERNVVPL